MDAAAITGQTIDDSRSLYAGGFRYRSLAGFCLLLISGMMGGSIVWSLAFSPIRFLVPVAIIGVVVVLTLQVVWIVRGKQRNFSIGTAGIVDGKKFIPWSEVRRFAAEGQPGGTNLTLFYETVSSSAFSRHALA